MSQLAFNKACEIEDFANPELAATIREVFQHEIHTFTPDFPKGVEAPRYWEAAMGVRALRNLGALTPEATVLVVGAGYEPTPFYLTRHARQVFAIDRYLAPDGTDAAIPRMLLLEPEQIAPYQFDFQRLVIQHMDERALRFPDDLFDGILVLGAIEHAGSLKALANSAFELGRVLKPGGVLSLSTLYRIAGPPGGVGYNGTPLPSPDEIRRYVVEASGLEPVDALCLDLSETTLASRRDLTHYAETGYQGQGLLPLERGNSDFSWSRHPYVIHVHQGYVFSSLHLTLRKTPSYPAAPNTWAQPNDDVVEAIRHANEALLTVPVRTSAARQAVLVTESVAMQRSSETLDQMRAWFKVWDEARIRGWYNKNLRRLPGPLASVGRTLVRVGMLGKVHEAQAQLSLAIVDHHAQVTTRLEETGTRIVGLEVRSDEHTDQLTSVQSQARQQAQIAAALAATGGRMAQLAHQVEQQAEQIRQLQHELEAQHLRQDELGGYAQAQQELIEQVAAQQSADHQQLAARQDELNGYARAQQELIEQVAAEQSRLDQRTRQAIGYTRLVRQQFEGSQRAPADDTAAGDDSTDQLSREEAQELAATLERELPALAERNAIEVSAQGTAAESLIVTLAEYFGRRTSSYDTTYRFPNDAWYHVDFTAGWNRPNLFTDAVSRLGSDGYFVLITSPEHTSDHEAAGLEYAEDRLLVLNSGRQVRAYIWRRA